MYVCVYDLLCEKNLLFFLLYFDVLFLGKCLFLGLLTFFCFILAFTKYSDTHSSLLVCVNKVDREGLFSVWVEFYFSAIFDLSLAVRWPVMGSVLAMLGPSLLLLVSLRNSS